MSEIGAYEAKTRFSELLRRVEKEECFVITRHGGSRNARRIACS